MATATPLEQFCDDHWDETTLEDFLACVAGKMAERIKEDGLEDDEMAEDYVGDMVGELKDLIEEQLAS